ncbi:MAG: AAA family ATPase [Chloroflexota bacterium]
MKRILLTGMSGVGKSTSIQQLRLLGYQAIDMDEAGWSVMSDDGDWIWNDARIDALLDSVKEGDVLFVGGCAENQGQYYPRFAKVILLSAPEDVIIHRLTTRTTNSYGKDPSELAETLDYIKTVEPLLPQGADHEIVTTIPIEDVIKTILKIVND